MDSRQRARLFATALMLVAVGACSSSPSRSGSGQDAGPSAGNGGSGMTTGSGGGGGGGGGGGQPQDAGSGGVLGTGGVSSNDAGGGDDTPVDVDAGGDVGEETAPAACPYLFCEDFESDKSGSPPDPTKWTQDGTAAIVDGVKPHNGSLALHVLPHAGALCVAGAPTCAAARFVRLTNAFPQALHKQHYGRMYFYINQTPTDSQYYHWMVQEVNASTSYGGGLAVRQGGEMPAGGPVSNGVARNYMLTHLDTHNTANNPFEADRGRGAQNLANKTWYCLEWFIDATNNKAQYWLNSQQIPALTWTGPVAGQPQFNFPAEFKSVAFGMRVFQKSTMLFELFIDDIALDAKQIGCP